MSGGLGSAAGAHVPAARNLRGWARSPAADPAGAASGKPAGSSPQAWAGSCLRPRGGPPCCTAPPHHSQMGTGGSAALKPLAPVAVGGYRNKPRLVRASSGQRLHKVTLPRNERPWDYSFVSPVPLGSARARLPFEEPRAGEARCGLCGAVDTAPWPGAGCGGRPCPWEPPGR